MNDEMGNDSKLGTAAEWFVEIDSDDLDSVTEKEFADWLASDPENERALERCEAAVQAAASLENDPDLCWAFDEIDALGKPQAENDLQTRARPWFTRPRFAWFFPGLAAVCVAAVLVVYDQMRVSVEEDALAAGGLMGDTLAPGSLPDPTIEIPIERLPNSIAVLPFDDLSPNLDDASFAAGIHEEILNQLAQIGDLNVIERTSVMPDEDSVRPITEIARDLNVQTVMEGSVRYDDGRVRISVQLIDAETSAHLWAETYDRDFSNILEVEADIARSLAEVLEAEIAVGNTLQDTFSAAAAVVPERSLVWVDREGREEPLPFPSLPYTSIRLSPEGSRIASSTYAYDETTGRGEEDLWVLDLARQTLTRLTFDSGPNEAPIWTPDAQSVVFRSGGQVDGIYWKPADGTGSPMPLTMAGNTRGHFPSSISADGTMLFFNIRGYQSTDAYMLPLYGERTPQPLMASPNYQESWVSISPDGRWIAYTSNETGQDEVYVRPFPNIDAGRWQVSLSGGGEPAWALDGQQLYYRYGNTIFEVDVDARMGFSAGAPQIVVVGPYVAGPHLPSYDVSPDGQRFLLMKDVE